MSEKYTFVEKIEENTDRFRVIIVADSNDGDYMTETDYFSPEDFDRYAVDALLDLSRNYSEDYKLKDYPNDSDLCIPYNGFDGYCHTLESLTIEYIDHNGKVWSVELNEEDHE